MTDVVALVAARDTLRGRLDTGWQVIAAGLAAGQDVTRWEEVWCALLTEYESVCDHLRAAARRGAGRGGAAGQPGAERREVARMSDDARALVVGAAQEALAQAGDALPAAGDYRRAAGIAPRPSGDPLPEEVIRRLRDDDDDGEEEGQG